MDEQSPNDPDPLTVVQRMSLQAKLALLFARQSLSVSGGDELTTLHFFIGVGKSTPGMIRRLTNGTWEQWGSTALRRVTPGTMHPESVELPFSTALERVMLAGFRKVEGDSSLPLTIRVLLHESWRLDPLAKEFLVEQGVTQEALDQMGDDGDDDPPLSFFAVGKPNK